MSFSKTSQRAVARPPNRSATTRRLQSRAGRGTSPSRSRRWQVAFHPLSVLLFLCVGVLLAAATINGFADSYDVKAIVPADLLTQPATLVDPSDGMHVAASSLQIDGTCPDNSYVKAYVAGVFAGVDSCAADHTFRMAVTLQPGANVLHVQAYNSTDQAGPASADHQVYYDPPEAGAPADSGPPVVAPETLQIMQVDTNVAYTTAVPVTDQYPTFAGIAPPLAKIHILIHSDPVTCDTPVSSQGYWRCTVTRPLDAGIHHVFITATEVNGKVLTFPEFLIHVVPVATASRTAPVPASSTPLTITADYRYTVYALGQTATIPLVISGGHAPYALAIDWGDGNHEVISAATDGAFPLTHRFGWLDTELGSFTIKIQITDSTGAITSLQYTATVRNPSLHNAVVVAAHNSGMLGFLDGMQGWLWLLWPGYLIVVLMLISFWLGERQEFLILSKRHRKTSVSHK